MSFVQCDWIITIFYGMLIFLAVLSTNMIGDILKNVINLHLNDRDKEEEPYFSMISLESH